MEIEHEESKEDPEKGNLFFNFRNIFLEKCLRKYIRENN